jgi:hypothetical protein
VSCALMSGRAAVSLPRSTWHHRLDRPARVSDKQRLVSMVQAVVTRGLCPGTRRLSLGQWSLTTYE